MVISYIIRHDITEILLKVVLNTINLKPYIVKYSILSYNNLIL